MRLNCDIGESFGAWTMGLDEQVMPYIDQANIACGFHAGDPSVMTRTVRLALTHGVTLGAHPAYPDLQGFGRRAMACKPEEITAMVLYQVGALTQIAASEGGHLAYVKPHGALYNSMMRDDAILHAVLTALRKSPQPLALMAMATADNAPLKRSCAEQGVELMLEAFADRAYDSAGYIVSRSQPGAVHHDPDVIVQQAIALARHEPIQTIDGQSLTLEADTLCVHGDNPESIAAVRAIRDALPESA
ncbi:5-oxoprolinase subunit PxpA [Marinobacter nanhaiticus D15-8W]|uniref:5-oxoprolinase subunit A n=1 Tax=Marinobacter nanhaiticus D15-8W TaxID=626887 RepID=N6WPC2_9GAMM|nr:5-oxoprolinase subunit PxpA [Marinobacter nanhaiticus]ENO12912.1 5-oxoprolinase subunit PxpA [Marinobacter nanhaiticus D15-8W]BES70263.1 5-oxoprolinase subunit PxpA [Marinobacter nanhaiticus D15-8W]